MYRPRLFVALALVGLAGLSWWFTERIADDTQGDSKRSGQRSPDHFVRRLEVTTLTPEGLPGRSLRADEVRHFLDDQSTELSAPRVTIHQESLPPWQITAESGWVSRDGEQVLLSGAVRIERGGTADDPPVVLLTSNLRFTPAEDYAETDERVTIDSEQDHVEALGMRAWLRRPGRVKLLSEVKGRYVPR